MIQHAALSNREAQSWFYLMAQKAIDQGLLSIRERDTISRRHTRKAGNWRRHVRDLHSWFGVETR